MTHELAIKELDARLSAVRSNIADMEMQLANILRHADSQRAHFDQQLDNARRLECALLAGIDRLATPFVKPEPVEVVSAEPAKRAPGRPRKS